MKASASISIKSTITDTFNAFTDVAKRKHYLPEIIKLKVDSLLVEGKGVKWYEVRNENGIEKNGHLEIVRYLKPKAFMIVTKSSGLIFKTRYNFQYESANSTKVVVSIGGRPTGILSAFMDKFLKQNSGYMGQQLQHELELFKYAIEKENPK